MDLKDKVVLITGAKRVGDAVARHLAARGADVAITFNSSRAEADETVAAVRALGRRALAVQTNVADPAGVDALVASVEREFGRLDVLVNMASLYLDVPFDKLDFAAWQKQLSVDLHGTFLCSKAAVPLMRRAGGGRIINISDWLSASGRPRYKGYSAYYVV